MRNRLLKRARRVLALTMVLLLLLGCASAWAEDTVSETKALMDGILSYSLNAADAAGIQSWLEIRRLKMLRGKPGRCFHCAHMIRR